MLEVVAGDGGMRGVWCLNEQLVVGYPADGFDMQSGTNIGACGVSEADRHQNDTTRGPQERLFAVAKE